MILRVALASVLLIVSVARPLAADHQLHSFQQVVLSEQFFSEGPALLTSMATDILTSFPGLTGTRDRSFGLGMNMLRPTGFRLRRTPNTFSRLPRTLTEMGGSTCS